MPREGEEIVSASLIPRTHCERMVMGADFSDSRSQKPTLCWAWLRVLGAGRLRTED